MALEIKVLDYGDIELESSFLVLGRDCGRTRRVPVFGFLILGGTWPVLVDTGYRSNQIMETLGMRGLQSHENMTLLCACWRRAYARKASQQSTDQPPVCQLRRAPIRPSPRRRPTRRFAA